MGFKVGDKVKCVDNRCSDFEKNQIYTVLHNNNNNLGYIALEGSSEFWSAARFKKVDPTLETELRLCESRKGILSERIGKDQEEKKSLEKRIQELQQAIKERDKPRGRIKVGDNIPFKSFLICATGDVKPHTKNSWSTSNVAMGNLFFDRKSAERAVHDRKQRVLRGEAV